MPNRKEPQLNIEPRLDPAQPHRSSTESVQAKAPLTSARHQPAATPEAKKAADAASVTTPPAAGASVSRAKLAHQPQEAQTHPEAVLRRAAALKNERLAQQAASAASASASQHSQTAAPASAAAPDSQSASMQQQRATAKAEAPDSIAASGVSGGDGGNYGGDGSAATSSGKQGLGWLAAGLLVVLILSGLGGWQLFALNQQLQSQIGALEVALSDRLEELEVRLLETDEGLSQTGQTFRGRLDWADEEIHKLWRLANNRMRPAISELQEQVSPLPEQLARLQTAVQPLPDRITQLGREQQEIEGRLTARQERHQQTQQALQQQVQQIEQQTMEASLMLTALSEQVRNRAGQEQIRELQAQVEGLVDQWRNELEPQLANQTEQLNSLDLSRQQLVSRLTQLMDEMSELYQRLEP